MIILPDHKIARGKVLLPMRTSEWRAPSRRRVTFGIEDQIRFRLTARLSDGHVVWRGWFDDRVDCDEFLLALITGSLNHERALWDLPVSTWMPGYGYGNVGWRPDLGEGLYYAVDTQVFFTASPGSNQTWTAAIDVSSQNFAEVIGGGGSSGGSNSATGSGGSGGGGGYAKTPNLSIASGNTITYQIGNGFASTAAVAGNGTAGGDSWFNGTTLGGSSVGAKGGGPGLGTSSGGAGGATAGAIGSVKFKGGDGGVSGAAGGQGGGGAAGPLGPGGNGGAGFSSGSNGGGGGGGGNGGGSNGSNASTANGAAGGNNQAGTGGGAASGGTGNNGSNGGGGSGGNGSGSSSSGGVGGDGTEWDASHGSGGGGGGSGWVSGVGSNAGQRGGAYGSGSGGPGYYNNTGFTQCGPGMQGMIAFTYTPGFKVPYQPLQQLGPIQAM